MWRRWHRKINIKQKRYAVVSALAASALPSLVMARGHKIDGVPEVPLVVSDKVQDLSSTAGALKLLKAVGAHADVAKVIASKNLHKGKGKMRNRRYTMRRGPLVVYSGDGLGITRAFRNIPGVELAHVERLNLLQLAPGGHMGRFCIWTKSAFAALDGVFGTASALSTQKSGYKLPRPLMSNPDLNRVINSDEIQSVVKPPKDHHARAPLKKNPLRNLGAMLKLNPYSKARAPRRPAPRRCCRGWNFLVPYWIDPGGLGRRMKRTLLCMLRHGPLALPPHGTPAPALTRLPHTRRSAACRCWRTRSAPAPRLPSSPRRARPSRRVSRRLAAPSPPP